MNCSNKQGVFIILLVALVFTGGDTPKNIVLLVPFPADSISYDQAKLIIVSASKDIPSDMLLSTQWETKKLLDISSKTSKENFPKEVYKIFAPQTTLQMFSYSFKYFKGYSKPESLMYAYTDTISIQGLWRKPEFVGFMKTVQTTEASDVILHVKGWKDTVNSAVYDDPNNEGRTLRKFAVQLIPGRNHIYFGPLHEKNNAGVYSTEFVNDSKPVSDRPNRFHNSQLEQSCTSCHDGLPSAGDGKTMTADCNVCHTAMVGAAYIHGPVEMKECSSCHSWSAEKKVVAVEKSVPTVCYDCHGEKQAQVDSSKYPHAVASDCLTCHSSHGTNQKHLLKKSVYDLCTGCHEDQKINHPVGRHPLQFAALKSGEEISCVSCHNPHGSQYEKLRLFPGGKMDICTQCH